MSIFKKKSAPTIDYKQFVIDWLRESSDKTYKDVIKIVEIYREADEKVAVIEAGSKKALREQAKEDAELNDATKDLFGAEEFSDGK